MDHVLVAALVICNVLSLLLVVFGVIDSWATRRREQRWQENQQKQAADLRARGLHSPADIFRAELARLRDPRRGLRVVKGGE